MAQGGSSTRALHRAFASSHAGHKLALCSWLALAPLACEKDEAGPAQSNAGTGAASGSAGKSAGGTAGAAESGARGGSGGGATGGSGGNQSGDASATGGSPADAASENGRGAGDAADAAGSAGRPTETWDFTGVVGTGQSLSVGATGTPVKSASQNYSNLKLSLGNANVPPFDPTSRALTLVPLVEPLRPLVSAFPSAYPHNIYGETPHTAMSEQISALVRASTGGDYVTVHTAVGENGQRMAVIGKGATDTGTTGRAYAATLFEAAAIARLARQAGKTYGIGAIVLTHGESDAGDANYGGALVELWFDYNADLRSLTGQSATIPMFVSQQHSSPSGENTRSASTQAQWYAGVTRPGEIVCSGPKYQYTYSSDAIHLTAEGYQRLGEKLGQIYFEKVVKGRDFQPLQPIDVQRNGRTINVRFHVPVPPLAWDNSQPAPHQSALTEWMAGRGFEVRTETTRIGISSVAIAGDTVEIACASDLPAQGLVVGYAMTSDGTAAPARTFRSGQLRDSDPFVGSKTGAQPNYAVSFELVVP